MFRTFVLSTTAIGRLWGSNVVGNHLGFYIEVFWSARFEAESFVGG